MRKKASTFAFFIICIKPAAFLKEKQKNSIAVCNGVCCERAVKRCVNAGKNSKKYTGKLLDKLGFFTF